MALPCKNAITSRLRLCQTNTSHTPHHVRVIRLKRKWPPLDPTNGTSRRVCSKVAARCAYRFSGPVRRRSARMPNHVCQRASCGPQYSETRFPRSNRMMRLVCTTGHCSAWVRTRDKTRSFIYFSQSPSTWPLFFFFPQIWLHVPSQPATVRFSASFQNTTFPCFAIFRNFVRVLRPSFRTSLSRV